MVWNDDLLLRTSVRTTNKCVVGFQRIAVGSTWWIRATFQHWKNVFWVPLKPQKPSKYGGGCEDGSFLDFGWKTGRIEDPPSSFPFHEKMEIRNGSQYFQIYRPKKWMVYPGNTQKMDRNGTISVPNPRLKCGRSAQVAERTKRWSTPLGFSTRRKRKPCGSLIIS